jgi:hypothetical protein
MTLKYMQGFESMRDDTDLRAQNWIAGPVKLQSGFSPSVTGVAGTSMRLIGAGSASTIAAGAASAPDIGYYNTGITVNQAWTSGGFTFGFNAKFNSGNSISYGAGSTANPMGCCFDGTRYWAIQSIAGVYTVAFSTNLQTWTTTTSQPSGGLDSSASIAYMGAGVVAVVRVTGTTNLLTVYYTNNLGVSWSSQVLATSSSSTTIIGSATGTGNSAFPHAVLIGTNGASGSNCGIYVGTLGGTMTLVSALTGINAANKPHIVGGLLVFPVYSSADGNSYVASATASNSALNTTGAWSLANLGSGNGAILDIAYSPSSNNWVFTSTTGLGSFANSGSAGNPVAPTGTISPVKRYSTAGMLSVWWTGTQFMAHGQSGHIVTSPDGVTWTESGGHLLPVGTSGTDWRSSLYDGSKYVIFSDATNGVVATTPDGVTNYQAQYIADGTENRNTTNACGATAVLSGTAPASTGLWTSNSNIAGFNIGAVSSNARTLSLYYGTGAASAAVSGSVSTTSLNHYYEIQAVSTATANTFLLSLYVDGVLLCADPTGRLQGSATTDTTSLMILAMARTASFTAFDDIYFTLRDGSGLSGTLGPVNIVAETPATDVSTQWVKNGTATSNSLSAGSAALSLTPSNYVSSANAGDKDVYGTTTGVIPATFNVRAVQVEGYFSKTGSGTFVANVGLVSGGTESDGANQSITGTTPTYTSQIYEKNPNGNVSWTNTTAEAANTVLNHIS